MADKQDNQVKLHRDYCFFMDGSKYNRNIACKRHDNAYGIKGGGDGKKRKELDRAFYQYMKGNNDPMALPTYIALRTCGWFFFNYKSGKPWKGQLIKKIFKGYLRNK